MPFGSSASSRVSGDTDVNSSFGSTPKSVLSSIRSASSLGSFGSNSENGGARSKSRFEKKGQRKKKKKNGSGGIYIPSERALRMVENKSSGGLCTTTCREESPISNTCPKKREDEKEVSCTTTCSKKEPGRAGLEYDEEDAVSKNEKENHSTKVTNKFSKVVLDDDVSSLATVPSSIDDPLENARRSQQQTRDAGVVGKSVCTGWIS